MPKEVEAEVTRSREFSKVIKKRCGGIGVIGNTATGSLNLDKKMKMEELLEMQKESTEMYFVITPEMITLNEYVAKAYNWLEKAELLSRQVVSLKTL
jgi:hypothetical protein